MIGFYAICLTGDLIDLYSQLEPAAFRDSIASSPEDKELHNRGMTSTEEISNVQHGEDCTMVPISLLRQPAAFSPNSNSQCMFYPHLRSISKPSSSAFDLGCSFPPTPTPTIIIPPSSSSFPLPVLTPLRDTQATNATDAEREDDGAQYGEKSDVEGACGVDGAEGAVGGGLGGGCGWRGEGEERGIEGDGEGVGPVG